LLIFIVALPSFIKRWALISEGFPGEVLDALIEGFGGELEESSTEDKLLDISKTVIREKYADSQASTVLDRQFAQLRQYEPHSEKTEISKQQSKMVFGDSLDKTYLYFSDEWDFIIERKNAWQNNMEKCYLLLKNNNDDYFDNSKKKGIVAQCQTRFSPKRKKDTHVRMEQFSKKAMWMNTKKGLQITLTTDPKKFDTLAGVGDKWFFGDKKFKDWMNLRLRRAEKKQSSIFLASREITESGLLHTHIGLIGKGITGKILMRKYNYHIREYEYIREFLFPKDDIKKEWSKVGAGEVTWINAAPVNECVDYITKHVAKSWGGKSNDMLEAFLHYTHLRQWSCSRGAVPKIPPSIERWELWAFANNPGEALLYRQDLIDYGATILPFHDDLKNLKFDDGG
jgi:hypothetical protein